MGNTVDTNSENPPKAQSQIPNISDETLPNDTTPLFEVGQRVQASDLNRGRWTWYNAIVKEVDSQTKMVKIGWLNDKWADSKWDVWINDINARIRDPDTKQPYAYTSTYVAAASPAAQTDNSHTSAAPKILNTSKKPVCVNPAHVSTWNTNTIITWIRSMQKRIESASYIQINPLIAAIKRKKITGMELIQCSTQLQFADLFEQEPAPDYWILRCSLNIEKKAWELRETSKGMIKNGRWTPRVGEKIRCIDTRYKSKSYEARIKQVEQHRILVHYDGYSGNNDQWVAKKEWVDRITIIEQPDSDNQSRKGPVPPTKTSLAGPKYIAPFRNKIIANWSVDDVGDWVDELIISTRDKSQTKIKKQKKAMKNILAANQINGALLLSYENGGRLYDLFGDTGGVSKSFCDKLWQELTELLNNQKARSQPISQPFVDAKQNDIGYVENPQKPIAMFEVGQRVEASDWNRGRLDWYAAIIKDVNKRNKMVKIGWLNDKWARESFDKWFHSHEIEKRIRDPDTKQPYTNTSAALNPAWKVKHIDTWTSPELQEWLHSLNLKNKYVKKIVEAISEQEISGADFNSMSEVSEIMDSFEIKQMPATKILSALDIIRSKTETDNVQQASNDLKRIRSSTVPSKQAPPPKSVYPNINKRRDPPISKTFNSKHVKNWTNKDLLAWIKTIGLETKWEEIMTKAIESTGCIGRDLFAVKHFKEFAKSLNIKQPMLANKVFREFKKVKQKQVNDNENDNDVSPVPSSSTVSKSKQTKIVFVWQSKHINEWACKELQEWIHSLNLSKSIERKVVKAISEQEITGEDFNSMDDMSDVVDSFEIKEISAKKIYAALLHVRISLNENALKKLHGNQ